MQVMESENFPLNFVPEGFIRMNFQLPDKYTTDIYSGINLIHTLVRNKHDENLVAIDAVLEEYYLKHFDRLSSGASYTLKNIIAEKDKYILISYQYLDGSYEYLEQNLSINTTNQHVIDFLKATRDAHLYIKKALTGLLEFIEKKTPCFTVLKAWKYPPTDRKEYLLPLHYDTSLFTIIVHTINAGKECLRIGPYGDGSKMEDLRKKAILDEYYQPTHNDFPILFPGVLAKRYFDINPTAHAVTTPELDFTSSDRYSLVFMIIPYELKRLSMSLLRK